MRRKNFLQNVEYKRMESIIKPNEEVETNNNNCRAKIPSSLDFENILETIPRLKLIELLLSLSQHSHIEIPDKLTLLGKIYTINIILIYWFVII